MPSKPKSELEIQVIEGLKRSRKKLIEFKKQKNSPLVVMRDGKIVHIPADELQIPD